jgi:hypothetical protein
MSISGVHLYVLSVGKAYFPVLSFNLEATVQRGAWEYRALVLVRPAHSHFSSMSIIIASTHIFAKVHCIW